MSINSKRFRVKAGEKVKLNKWPTQVKPYYESKEQYQEFLGKHIRKLSAQQNLLYASNRYSFLVVFQGMDTAGKDGAIKHLPLLDAHLMPEEARAMFSAMEAAAREAKAHLPLN